MDRGTPPDGVDMDGGTPQDGADMDRPEGVEIDRRMDGDVIVLFRMITLQPLFISRVKQIVAFFKAICKF